MTNDPFAVGFTGSRTVPTDWQQKRLLELFQFLVGMGAESFHHGDCTGSDAVSHDLAIRAGFDHIVVHPPNLSHYRAFCDTTPPKGITLREAKPYLTRNRDIVVESAILVATPKSDEILRSGTWSTVRYARQCDRAIYIILPYRISVENDPFDWEPATRFASPWEDRKDRP
jgi:hypothetical protein